MNKYRSLPAIIILSAGLLIPVVEATALTSHRELLLQHTATVSFIIGENSQQAIRALTASAVVSGNYRPSSVFNTQGMKAASGIVKDMNGNGQPVAGDMP